MAKIYDTGDIQLDDGGAVIAQNYWSDLEEVTINDYAAKIVKVILEFSDCAAVSGTLYIFSETNGSWANNGAASLDPVGTTGEIEAISCDELYEVSDTAVYFANNDTTAAKTLYVAYRNTNADDCKLKVRILYESLALG